MQCSFTCVAIVCGLKLLACSTPVLVQCVSSVCFFLTFCTLFFSNSVIMTLMTPFYNLQQIIKASEKQFYKPISTFYIPVVARSKAWFCGRSLGLRVRIPPGHGYLCCVVTERSLRPADLSSRGFLPIMVCLSVIVKRR